MFKTGDKVVCISVGNNHGHLTEGKQYVVEYSGGGYVAVTSDAGESGWNCSEKRFKHIETVQGVSPFTPYKTIVDTISPSHIKIELCGEDAMARLTKILGVLYGKD